MKFVFHKVKSIGVFEPCVLIAQFEDGVFKTYDIRQLTGKYPSFRILEEDPAFFGKVKIDGSGFGVVWNDELDIEAETVYEDGITVRTVRPAGSLVAGEAVAAARARKGISQMELAEATGIDQSDISKIERGVANPSVGTLSRIAEALDGTLVVSII